jgi:hypothetical protein
MENQELALGQRRGKDIMEDSSWTPEELKLMEDNNVDIEDVIRHWVIVGGEDTLNAAIGGAALIRGGLGQDRNMSFQTQEEADASVSGKNEIHNINELVPEQKDLPVSPDTSL